MFAHSLRSFACSTTYAAEVEHASAALDAPVSFVHGLENVMLDAGEPRPLAVFEGSGYVVPQLRLILLDRQNTVSAPFDDLTRDLLPAAHGVYRHDAAFYFKRLEQFGYGGYLVGMVVGFDLSERGAVGGRPRARHVDGGFAVRLVGGAPDCLAVNRRDLHFGGFPDPFCPFDEYVLEVPRVDEGKDAPEGVVGGYSIGEFEEGLEPVDFGVAEGFDIDPAVGDRDDAQMATAIMSPRLCFLVRSIRGPSTLAKWSMMDMDCVFPLRRLLSRGLPQF